MPQTSPVQPQGAMPQPQSAPAMPQGADLMGLMSQIAQQYQMPAMAGEMGIAKQMGPLTQEAPIPKMGYQPEFQPITGQGPGGDIKNLLGDVGKALLLGLSATGPGRAVQGAVYGPRVRQYEAGQQQKAQRIAGMKGQAEAYGQTGESASRAISGLGEASWRQGMLGVQQDRTRIQQQKADAYVQSVQNRLQVALKGLDLNALRTGSQLELNKARTALTQAMPELMQQRNEISQYGIDVGNETRQAVANVTSQLGIDRTHPVAQMLDSLLGTNLVPAAPQTPGGQQPVSGQSPLPKRSTAGKNVPKGTVVYDPQGRAHQADGTAPLPKGWSMKK
jgi:hypothetical protein